MPLVRPMPIQWNPLIPSTDDVSHYNGHVRPPVLAPPLTVGGTSGGSGDHNILSVNLAGGAFSYDIGPNTERFANNAYNYLDNAFREDSALLGATIIGGQHFLSGFATPLARFNTGVLPSMFGTLNEQNFALGSEALQVEGEVARASIAGSQASAQAASQVSGGGGGCFITTAACEAHGERDDGPTLTALRSFRDRFMLATPARRMLVRHYYHVAPLMVKVIQQRPDAREFLERIFTVYIMPARAAIKRGENERAFYIYAKAMFDIHKALTHG